MTEEFEVWIVQYIPRRYKSHWVNVDPFLSIEEADDALLSLGDLEKRIVYIYAGGTVLDVPPAK